MKELHQITHKDLDGAVCAILVKEYCRQKGIEYRVYPSTYRTVDDVFKKIYIPSRDSMFPMFVLTDISLTKEPGNIGEFKNILFIDHHPKPAPSLIKNKVVVLDKEAACMLTYNTMLRMGARYNENMRSLVTFASDYDTWTHKFKMAKKLNQLYFLYSFDEFVSRFSQGLDELNSDETTFLKWKQQELMNKFASMKVEHITDEIAFVTANLDVDEIAQHLYEKRGYKYVLIWKPKFAGVSIRSSSASNLDLAEFARQHGGGGYKHAGAVLLFLNQIEEVADLIEKFIAFVEKK